MKLRDSLKLVTKLFLEIANSEFVPNIPWSRTYFSRTSDGSCWRPNLSPTKLESWSPSSSIFLQKLIQLYTGTHRVSAKCEGMTHFVLPKSSDRYTKFRGFFFEGWRTFCERRRFGLPRLFHGKVGQFLSIGQSRGNVSGFSVGDLIKHKKIGKN